MHKTVLILLFLSVSCIFSCDPASPEVDVPSHMLEIFRNGSDCNDVNYVRLSWGDSLILLADTMANVRVSNSAQSRRISNSYIYTPAEGFPLYVGISYHLEEPTTDYAASILPGSYELYFDSIVRGKSNPYGVEVYIRVEDPDNNIYPQGLNSSYFHINYSSGNIAQVTACGEFLVDLPLGEERAEVPVSGEFRHFYQDFSRN